LYGIEAEAQLAKRYKVELSPSLVITSYEGDQEPGYALRFAGIPSGYEFGSFIQAILMVSKRDSGLKPEIRQALKSINKPIQLKVFVTPT
jgi:alkyl hydroperoxide reductase subunit AhpF